MTKPRHYKVTQKRFFSAHHSLLMVAQSELSIAKKKPSDGFNHALVAITFSALAVEAMCNAIGERLFPTNWEDFETANPNAKLCLLAMKLDVPYSKEQAPWKAIRWLTKFRNKIVHAKPELIIENKLIAINKFPYTNKPKAKIEREITIGNATRVVEAVKQIREIFCSKIPPEHANGLYVDMWQGVTSAQEEA